MFQAASSTLWDLALHVSVLIFFYLGREDKKLSLLHQSIYIMYLYILQDYRFQVAAKHFLIQGSIAGISVNIPLRDKFAVGTL